MKNVTITLKDPVVKFARILAAKQSKSLSKLVSGMLEDLMKNSQERVRALEEFLQEEPYIQTHGRMPSREEIYDRKVFR